MAKAGRNPLTGLPGNTMVRDRLQRNVIHGGHTAAFLDVTGFKPFNDHYGLSLGDHVIRRLAEILSETVHPHFVGHVGGDDFVCTGPGQDFTAKVEKARLEFRAAAPGFYGSRDREAGGIETFDRYGGYRFFPFLDLTVVMITAVDGAESVEDLCRRAGAEKSRLRGVPVPGRIGPLLASDPLAGMAARDSKALIEAAGILREKGAVPELKGILQGSYGWNLRKSAALSLGRIGGEEAVEALLNALSDSSPHVRTRAVEGLVLASGSSAGPVIAPMAGDPSTWVRRAAYRGMGRTRTAEALPVLERAAVVRCANTLNMVQERAAALDGLALLGDPASAPFLAGLCADLSYEPANHAFRALCSVGGEEAAVEILRRGVVPEHVRLEGVSREKLAALEELAVSAPDRKGLRLLSILPAELSDPTRSTLRKLLGSAGGALFLQLVELLEEKEVPADPSCAARVAARLERGDAGLDPHGLSRFLAWLSHSPGVAAGAFLKPFLRMPSGQVRLAAATALSARCRDLTQQASEKSFQDRGRST